MNIVDGFVTLTAASWNCPSDSPHEAFDEATAQAAGVAFKELHMRIEQALGSIPDGRNNSTVREDDFIAAYSQGYLMARYVERLAQRAGAQ